MGELKFNKSFEYVGCFLFLMMEYLSFVVVASFYKIELD